MLALLSCILFFFFNDTATTEIYTLSLHDALPISDWSSSSTRCCPSSAPPRRTALSPSSARDRKSTRLNSSHANISYAVFCLKKKKKNTPIFLLHNTTGGITSRSETTTYHAQSSVT